MQPPEAAVNQSAGASPFPPDSARPTHWLAFLLLLAAGTVVRFLYLGSKPFWFDEYFSAEVARISWSNFLHLLWWREANMSLYYLLLRMWLQFGHSEFYIRSLSVVIAAATIPAVYWLARLLYDRRVALIAAALLTFNAYSVRYAQEARSYALFLLLAALSSGFLIALVREPVRRNRVGYVLVSVLAVYAHFYALLLLAAHWLALRWMGRGFATDHRRQEYGGQLSAQLRRAWIAIGLAVLPLLVFVAKTGAGPIRWIQRPGIADVLRFCIYVTDGMPGIYLAACLVALVPLKQDILTRSRNWETWRVHFLFIWLLFPVVVTVLLSFARPVFLARYMIFCLPALVILVAAGLSTVQPAWLSAVLVCLVLILSARMVPFVYGHDFDNERDASGAAANFILDHAEPGDAAVFHIAETRVPYEFVRSLRVGENTASPSFTAALGPEILFPHHGAGLDYRDFTGKPAADFLRAAVPSHPRVWVMLMSNGPAGDPDPTTVRLTKVLPESFPKMQRWHFTKVEVRLYSRQ
jgi:mannosyltransferase